MDLARAQRLTVDLMREHNLHLLGWRFRYDRAIRRMGCCRHRRREITLSAPLVRVQPEDSDSLIRNVALHEIAHALVGHGAGHGAIWRRQAVAIGCDGQRLCGGVQVEPRRIGFCPSCGFEIRRHRAKRLACKRCCIRESGGRFDAAFAFVWRTA